MRKVSLFAFVALAGCAATPLQPGAEMVRVTNTEPGSECEFLGDITANQGNSFTGPFTTNENLETGARHDLKNKAAALGGNLVVLLTQRAGQTGTLGEISSVEQTNVTLSGNVYRCPT
ncbi:MAG TPA: DUF4156 domain-containing protein [Steroidobacter sp.]|uniref:DUF4156 domain-containing protein n=1 Tax=Steroidobacter sp. TaxID=1978227 RepID=UPI002ED92B1F